MATKDAQYKVHNGAEFEKIHFETKGSQVKMEDNSTAQKLKDDFESHKAENVTQAGGVHGVEIEEGTWTPIIRGGTIAGSHSYTTQEGYYTRIKNRVFLEGTVVGTKDENATGGLTIGNLPFVIHGNKGSAWVSDFSRYSLPAGDTLGATAFGGVNYIAIKLIGSGSSTVSIGDIASNFIIRFGASYIIN